MRGIYSLILRKSNKKKKIKSTELSQNKKKKIPTINYTQLQSKIRKILLVILKFCYLRLPFLRRLSKLLFFFYNLKQNEIIIKKKKSYKFLHSIIFI